MIHSIFTFGKSVVRRIMPFGPVDGDAETWTEDPLMAPDLISVGDFIESFRKLSTGTPSMVDTTEMENTVRNASQEWFKLLVGRDGLLKLLNASSAASQKFLSDLFFNNDKFLDAILANSSASAQQFAAGVKESPTIRRHVYLLLVALGMHSYDGYVLIYKTVNLLQRERPNGMFQYISEEIAGVTRDSRPPEVKLEALIPPLALMVVLFAGGNGFFIEGHLRQQIQSSKLLTSLVDIAQTKFVEEKHNRRLELPTLKEPSPRECTAQISQAIDILEKAERSSDKILLWLDKFADGNHDLSKSHVPVSAPNTELRKMGDGVEYVVNLESIKQHAPEPTASPESGYESIIEISTKKNEPKNLIQSKEIGPETLTTPPTEKLDQSGEILREAPPTGQNGISVPRPSLQSPPSLVSFEEFASGAAVPPVLPGPQTISPPVLTGPQTIFPPKAPEMRQGELPVKPASVVEGYPSGEIPPPPPPPPPPVMNPNGSVVDAKIASAKFKPLRWTKLDTSPDVVMQSIWEQKRELPQIDMDRLEEIFKLEKTKSKFGENKDHLSETDVNPTSLISPQTELRINVILKQFPDIDGEELAKKIQSCDVSEFDESQLKELLTALPSDQEFDQIEKLKGQFEPSKPAEHFLLGLLAVDHLKLRLEVMLFAIEFPVTERSVRRNCDDIVNACKTIQSSESFRNLLLTILKVGNKLNEGRAIGSAMAFDTNILPKLVDVPSSQPGVSLLHFLVDQLSECGPDALKFLDDLEPVAEMARIPLGQMKAEVLVAREKYAQLMEEMQEVPEVVQKSFQKLLQGMRSRLNSLSSVVVAAQERTQMLAIYLLEDPGVFQVHEYVEMLNSFLHSVRAILEFRTRRGSISVNNNGDSVSSVLHSAPLRTDPRTASVFESLRSELQTTLAFHKNEDG